MTSSLVCRYSSHFFGWSCCCYLPAKRDRDKTLEPHTQPSGRERYSCSWAEQRKTNMWFVWARVEIEKWQAITTYKLICHSNVSGRFKWRGHIFTEQICVCGSIPTRLDRREWAILYFVNFRFSDKTMCTQIDGDKRAWKTFDAEYVDNTQ